MPPKFFQIGFNKCGTTFIARLFDLNGIPALHWAEGALADDIAYSRLTGRAPLQRWSRDTVAFTDMESVRFLNMPVIEAFKDYAFLDASFPDAVFLLNTRDVDDWVASRYLHWGGRYARSYAACLGVPLADLGDIWRRDWHDHIAGCRAHFAGRDRFLDIDIDRAAPEDYRDALAPWFDLPVLPKAPGAGVRQARKSYPERLQQMLQAPAPDIRPDRRDKLAARLAGFARPARLTGRTGCPGDHALLLDLDLGRLMDSKGAAQPVTRGPDGRFYQDTGHFELLRTTSTANDIAQLADTGRYWLDMRPACLTGGVQSAGGPVIAGLRRRGASDVFLWPAPWLHRIGNAGFPGAAIADDPPFDDRPDIAVWRGALAGYAQNPGAQDLHLRVEGALGDPPDAQAIQRSARWRFLKDHAGMAGTDLALRADDRTRRALKAAGLSVPMRDDAPQGRYAICLGRSDGDADFLPLANSHAVVLKEEDGWESFATGLFKPWRHYIPLASGGADLGARLDWARANPDECRRISARARRICEGLADPAGRRAHLEQVLAAYRAATGQG
ncbi:MAG: glycosyl transferase family 90 [Paracoccus sp. (in: a-proteobacteria)]|uniref:glycosyl transferase family 90 n=1 Tax=Paracoccus sp. TaxID=267 RepID=UPI0032424597